MTDSDDEEIRATKAKVNKFLDRVRINKVFNKMDELSEKTSFKKPEEKSKKESEEDSKEEAEFKTENETCNKCDKRDRPWCFTINNYTQQNLNNLDKLYDIGKCTYLVYGFEKAPTTGTPHLQCYIEFKNAAIPIKKSSSWKKMFPTAHWERRRGTAQEASAYCKKDEDWREFGTLSKQGERTDFQRMFARIKTGASDLDLIEEFGNTAFRSLNAISKVRLLSQPKRTWPMEVRIYYGLPGTGKSRAVFDEFKLDEIFVKPKSKWWDGYEGQKVVVIDDFDPIHMDWSFDYMLTLLDRYPMSLEYKGGFVNMSSKIIIFTTNFLPWEWFPDRKNRLAFFRRINIYRSFGEEVIRPPDEYKGVSFKKINFKPHESKKQEKECSESESDCD